LREATALSAHGGVVIPRVPWRRSPPLPQRESPQALWFTPTVPATRVVSPFLPNPILSELLVFQPGREGRSLPPPTAVPALCLPRPRRCRRCEKPLPPSPTAVSSLREAIGSLAHGGVASPRVAWRRSPTLAQRECLQALWLRPTAPATRVVSPFLPKPIFAELLVFPSVQPAVPARGLALFEWC
jgi:hypothetical protein